ncbi:VOC family protein [Paenibacillus sp. GCM10023250]|uniref:VOC family protein n=1 Tax=Paenibacillus sp. GCM10023250 TaxID=3252648 RepID=UPI00360B9EEA
MSVLGMKKIEFITLFVEDLPRAKSFYETAFGSSPVFEDPHSAVYPFGNLSINLLVDTEAPGLIGPAKVAAREAGSRFQFTIPVEDVDGACEELRGRGVSLLNGPLDRPWGIRTACFADPDGHIWELAQQLG